MDAQVRAPDRCDEPYTAEQIGYWMGTATPPISALASLANALIRMREDAVRELPVVDDTGQLCGLIAYDDLTRTVAQRRLRFFNVIKTAVALFDIPINEAMTVHPLIVQPQTSLVDAAMLMITNDAPALVVVDDQHGLVGMITEHQLFRGLVSLHEPPGSHNLACEDAVRTNKQTAEIAPIPAITS